MKFSFKKMTGLGFICLSTACSTMETPKNSVTKSPEDNYLNYAKRDTIFSTNEMGTMKAKIQTFRHPEKGVEVTLAGMIHYADPKFYQYINKLIDESELVLTEGVSKDPQAPMTMQELEIRYYLNLVKRLTVSEELASQIHSIPTRPNMRSGDISFEQLHKITEGEDQVLGHALFPVSLVVGEVASFATGYYHALTHLDKHSRDVYVQNMRHEFCELIAQHMDDSPILPKASIIYTRNEHLLEQMDKAIEEGHKKILMPWGAAHMSHLETRLYDKGFVKSSNHWVTAIEVEQYLKVQDEVPNVVFLPYIYYYKNTENYFETSMILSAINYKSFEDYEKFDLLWGGLATNRKSGEDSYFRLFPSIFDKPLLYEVTRKDGKEKVRYLLFFESEEKEITEESL